MDDRRGSSRRQFLKASLVGMGATGLSRLDAVGWARQGAGLRLGGPVFEKVEGPEQWVGALKKLGYRAAYCPVGPDASDDLVKAYEQAAHRADIVIAEVGAGATRSVQTNPRGQRLWRNVAEDWPWPIASGRGVVSISPARVAHNGTALHRRI